MIHISTQSLKFSFFFFLFLTIYYPFVMLVLPIFTDPQIHRFEGYHRIMNWDLEQHAIGDFDNDGKEDVISYTGCAFLSSVNVSEIPQEAQCTATRFVAVKDNAVGQKYIQTNKRDLGAEAYDQGLPILHSYMGKNMNDNWKIYVNANGSMKVYEIESGGLLRNTNSISFVHYLDELLYFISVLFVILAVPLIPLSFILNVLGPFKLVSYITPIHEIVSLIMITIVLYIAWQYRLKSS